MTEATAEQIRKIGRRSLALKCDVTDEEQVEAAVSQTVDSGSVDILVNNAGTLDHVGQLVDQSHELWERDLRVNLTGAFNCSRAVWPHMKERGWGRIVNMASVAGTRRLRPGELLDDEGRAHRSHEDTRARGRSLRDHRQRDRSRHHRDRGVRFRQPGDEQADDPTDCFAGPASRRTSPTRSPSWCCDLAGRHHGRGAERVRRDRALHV